MTNKTKENLTIAASAGATIVALFVVLFPLEWYGFNWKQWFLWIGATLVLFVPLRDRFRTELKETRARLALGAFLLVHVAISVTVIERGIVLHPLEFFPIIMAEYAAAAVMLILLRPRIVKLDSKPVRGKGAPDLGLTSDR